MKIKKNIIALIPARSGSKRVKDKNIKVLNGRPLMSYTITEALESRIFDRVICSTDSNHYAEIASYYGAEVYMRSKKIASSKSPDYLWVKSLIDNLIKENYTFDIFSILRPTSPFRNKNTIGSAIKKFYSAKNIDSLRAVELCGQHPGKMWIVNRDIMKPLFNKKINEVPWHSNQYASLPKIYVQNASLEIAWLKTILKKNSISGTKILPFITDNLEGFDINTMDDWVLAEHYIKKGIIKLPRIKKFKAG